MKEKVSAHSGKKCSYYHQDIDRERSNSKRETRRKYSERERSYSDRIEYLEETVATLTVSLYTLQGQLLDMRDEMNDKKEESDETKTDDNVDENSFTDESTNESMSKESLPNECIASETESVETTMKVKRFNYGEKKDAAREISMEDLERCSKPRKYQSKHDDLECELCDYCCKKNTTMSKHMNTKHGGSKDYR